jgi:hypothetical protein
MIDPAKVPFYSNTPDDTHCFQAGMRMILGYFLPDREFSWKELEQLSAKVEGLSTWPQQMLINLRKMGFAATMVEGFDGHAFIRNGGQYLKEAFGEETAEWQIKNSDIPQEQKLYQEAYDTGVDIQCRVPTLADIQDYLQKGYLVAATINSRQLDGKDGYVGHFVVVLSIDDQEMVLHNPGLPARQAQRVTREQFMEAWADPNETAQNFIAIKKETI